MCEKIMSHISLKKFPKLVSILNLTKTQPYKCRGEVRFFSSVTPLHSHGRASCSVKLKGALFKNVCSASLTARSECELICT